MHAKWRYLWRSPGRNAPLPVLHQRRSNLSADAEHWLGSLLHLLTGGRTGSPRVGWPPSSQLLQGLFEWAIDSTQKLLPTLPLAARCPRPWKWSGRPFWALHPHFLYARGGPSPAIGGPSEPMSCQLQLITLGHMPCLLAVFTLNFTSCPIIITATFRCIARRAPYLHLALAMSLGG